MLHISQCLLEEAIDNADFREILRKAHRFSFLDRKLISFLLTGREDFSLFLREAPQDLLDNAADLLAKEGGLAEIQVFCERASPVAIKRLFESFWNTSKLSRDVYIEAALLLIDVVKLLQLDGKIDKVSVHFKSEAVLSVLNVPVVLLDQSRGLLSMPKLKLSIAAELVGKFGLKNDLDFLHQRPEFIRESIESIFYHNGAIKMSFDELNAFSSLYDSMDSMLLDNILKSDFKAKKLESGTLFKLYPFLVRWRQESAAVLPAGDFVETVKNNKEFCAFSAIEGAYELIAAFMLLIGQVRMDKGAELLNESEASLNEFNEVDDDI